MKLGHLNEHVNTDSSLEKPQRNARNLFSPCVLNPVSFFVALPHVATLSWISALFSPLCVFPLPSAIHSISLSYEGREANNSTLSSYSLFPNFCFCKTSWGILFPCHFPSPWSQASGFNHNNDCSSSGWLDWVLTLHQARCSVLSAHYFTKFSQQSSEAGITLL